MFIDSIGGNFPYVNVDIMGGSIVNVNARQREGVGGKKEVNLVNVNCESPLSLTM